MGVLVSMAPPYTGGINSPCVDTERDLTLGDSLRRPQGRSLSEEVKHLLPWHPAGLCDELDLVSVCSYRGYPAIFVEGGDGSPESVGSRNPGTCLWRIAILCEKIFFSHR
jgi:hypothetical protein